jgi:hypothetical protein
MTTTAPLPVIRETSRVERLQALERMGAATLRPVRYSYPTAEAVIDPDRQALFIACDTDPRPEDWNAICGLIRAVGFDNGNQPYGDDPGEPGYDPLNGVCVWRLEYV